MQTGCKGIVASAGHFARMGVALTFAAAASLAIVSTAPAEEGVVKAIAVLHPTANHSVAGIVRFTQVEGGVQVSATIEGLTTGKHGFHIHELGDCSAPDATSAGGHFNPEGQPHAGPDQPERHVGDLGNLEADEAGRARYERLDDHLSLGGEHSILGRAVIVHAAEDDFTTQPTGAAGGRVACGVIGIAKP